jgi:hypothetical protein
VVRWDVKIIASILGDEDKTGFSEAFVSFYQSGRNLLHIDRRKASHLRGAMVLTVLSAGHRHISEVPGYLLCECRSPSHLRGARVLTECSSRLMKHDV